MNHFIKTLFIFATFIIYTSAYADFQKGLNAAEKGDFITALREWLPLAYQGDRDAQYNLGIIYDNGHGVPEDDTEATRWYRLAADQGHVNGQFNLGVMYGYGFGVPEDNVYAYMWTNLAAAKGHEGAITNKKALQNRMTRDQIAQAQKLSREWAEKHQ